LSYHKVKLKVERLSLAYDTELYIEKKGNCGYDGKRKRIVMKKGRADA
jgi:hypothetical protein